MTSSEIMLLGSGVLVVLGIVFLLRLVYDRDPEQAAERTAQQSVGIVSGAGASFAAALAVGVDALLQAPELLISILGVGAITQGLQWEMYLAGAVLIWIVAMTWRAERTSGGA